MFDLGYYIYIFNYNIPLISDCLTILYLRYQVGLLYCTFNVRLAYCAVPFISGLACYSIPLMSGWLTMLYLQKWAYYTVPLEASYKWPQHLTGEYPRMETNVGTRWTRWGWPWSRFGYGFTRSTLSTSCLWWRLSPPTCCCRCGSTTRAGKGLTLF